MRKGQGFGVASTVGVGVGVGVIIFSGMVDQSSEHPTNNNANNSFISNLR